MRTWQTILDYVRRDPRGINADGRTLGLALAVAMEKANQQPTAEVEAFLRRRADEEQRIAS
ncbi:MAG TPA: hypothetical protein VGX25_16945 [Actinophytocola sp.]|uniref:hypothetical protein n=1 Tax=Actinophytocola sp. TaxID=1872138 RepID=UPI002DDDB0EB|nr:hypothetical protein [Actinophytocola sp.]HEV2781073.1 hypothetical protein [Actinophytocola sp.]